MCARPGFFRPVFCWPKGPQGGPHVRVQSNAKQPKYRPETRLVQSGILRSQFGETSEALFLTQGYVYDNSAQAEARFKGEDPGYQYSRFANPTVTMFEQRIAEFEGAEAARATATGMAAVTLSLMGQVPRRRPRRRLQGDLRLLPLRGRGLPAALRRHLHHRRRQRSRRVARGDAAEHQDLLPGDADQSEPRSARHRRDRQDRARGRRDRWWSTTCSRRRSGRARSRSAPTAWSIPPPSTSTARAAASAASSSARRSSSPTTSTRSSGRPARRCRRSTPGSCSRDWRRCRCGCASRPTRRRRSRWRWRSIRRCRG